MGYMEMFLREACGVSADALIEAATSRNLDLLDVAGRERKNASVETRRLHEQIERLERQLVELE